MRRRFPLLVAGTALVLATCYLFLDFPHGDIKDYITKDGVIARISLSDDSRMTLNLDTAVRTRSTETSLEITLIKGEMLLSVPHRSDRIFTVIAGGIQITDVGAVFDVRRPAKGPVAVSVAEGIVTLRLSAAETGERSVVAHAGQVALFGSNALAVKWVGLDEIEHNRAWAGDH